MGRAYVIEQVEQEGGKPTRTVELRDLDDAELPDESVTVDVEFSSINYKDALVLTGKPGVVREFPMVAGIDLVGVVAESSDPDWNAGDRVALFGDGLSETRFGGLSERARVRPDALVRVPDHVSSAQAAAIGTAGFTASLCVLALEHGGFASGAVRPGGLPVLVTGAGGGVGGIAIALLAAAGFEVAAATGRVDELGDALRELGASSIVDRAELSEAGRPLGSQRWAGAVDSVGGQTLATVLSQLEYGGTVASCGLAGGSDLPTTVMPFILRGVTLAGVNSVEAPRAAREAAWEHVTSALDLDILDRLTETVSLADAVDAAERVLSGSVHGRIVVDVRA
ncbi:acryloyl-CoA reductase [Plantibacter sp. VKM Ac-2880]|uniref:acrylyl-CoA reductase family protein n=1 Tax=Plantibacter sp. VKM Ac-2880 TaxID=2783827 RepID=UPI00188E4BF9|nr:acryloyl-CoA reductase [Plantibacter sp. VKM Ac-2880]MBF4570703.1 acryloyl-CoA reductase [Plantibacter sp. VKM Ac-2880]